MAHPLCPRTGKIQFPTEAEAREAAAARSISFGYWMDVYLCPFSNCGYWHLATPIAERSSVPVDDDARKRKRQKANAQKLHKAKKALRKARRRGLL